MRYRILERGTPETLAGIVNEFLLDGWKPQGGVSVAALGDDSYLYAQALVFDPANEFDSGEPTQ